MDVYLGLDIGGTKLLVAAADRDGTILRRARADTPRGLQEGLDLLTRLAEEVRGDDTALAVGASAGGPLDYRTGVVSPLHQPEWRDVPLGEIFSRRFGCPFFVDVDTNAAALAEWEEDGGESESLLYLTLSTGMGGGFVQHGRLYRGTDGAHPEAGHQAIPFRCAHPERVACDCGAPDCLEALVSGNGIRRVYGHPAQDLTPEEWGEVAYNLGLGLRNLAVLLTPDVIVLGGGVSVGGGEAFLEAAGQVMRERLFLTPPPRLRLSRLGYETALQGALALARQGKRPQ